MRVHVRVPNREVSALYATAPQVNTLQSLPINGKTVKPKIENGYAVITRTWKENDRIDFELAMPVQRVHASGKLEADRGKVTLRRGPLLYNIERVDAHDLNKALASNASLTTEWRNHFLNGVMVITGKFADGSPLLAIPNFERMNREPAPAPGVAGFEETNPDQHTHLPIASKVWIQEI